MLTIATLAVESMGYTDAGALIFDDAWHPFLVADARVSLYPARGAVLIVMRTRRGYIADVTYCDIRWCVSGPPLPDRLVPIASVVWGDTFLIP